MDEKLTIIAPNPERDLDDIIHLTGTTFDRYWEWRERCRHGYILNSPYDWASSRVAYSGDTLVGHFGVYDMTLRFGSAGLKTAGVGAVATHADMRGRGLMKQVASHAVDGLESAGYDVSLLYGIRNFYHKFGYVTGWPDLMWRVEAKELETEVPETEVVADWAGLADCSNRWNEKVPGTAVRPTFRDNFRPKRQFGRLWREENGEVAGFVVYIPEDGTLRVTDMAGEPEIALSVARRLAAEAWCRYVVLDAFPPASPYVRALKTRPYRMTAEAEPDGGPMLRVVSLRSTLEKLRPQLEQRVSGAALGGDLAVTLLGRNEALCITAHADGTVDILPTDGDRSHGAPQLHAGDSVVRLLLGTHSIDELIADGAATADESAVAVARLLFPEIRPSLPAWDKM